MHGLLYKALINPMHYAAALLLHYLTDMRDAKGERRNAKCEVRNGSLQVIGQMPGTPLRGALDRILNILHLSLALRNLLSRHR